MFHNGTTWPELCMRILIRKIRADVCIKTLTSVGYSQSLTEMERSVVVFDVLLCVFLFSQKIISGAEEEMKVRPGDNITLYCDRSLTHGIIVWIRNCSQENQTSLIIDFTKWGQEILWHFSSLHNRSSNSYDLHITNISVSDLGLYYCAEVENKVNYENGIIYSSKVYYYGNRKTRLSLAVSLMLSSSTSPPLLVYQTVFSAGRCCSVCVRCVFSSPHSCPPSVCTASVRGKLQVLSGVQRYSQ
ncbi:uncharacterized protein LOC125272517 isoform X2 [Megalobrama amblycephala]|uniref:uncharacterized protein LOC125272517 isoform X2 n=1 Tax=Megalobrama amblycephala TaxID=75352 RepID=UPI0020144FFC|nr:uncharacterized protein LOC125272517 isoform X2 [Megalobrama amblycephala]